MELVFHEFNFTCWALLRLDFPFVPSVFFFPSSLPVVPTLLPSPPPPPVLFLLSLGIIFFLNCIYLLCTCEGTCAMACMLRSEDRSHNMSFSSTMGSSGRTRVIKFGSKYFYLFCHLSRPRFLSWDYIDQTGPELNTCVAEEGPELLILPLGMMGFFLISSSVPFPSVLLSAPPLSPSFLYLLILCKYKYFNCQMYFK